MDDINEKGNISQQPGWMDVLMALKANIMRNLKVAELAIVKSIDNDKANCVLLNNPEKTFQAKNLFNEPISKDNLVLVLFLDSYSYSNLSKYKSTGKIEEIIKIQNKATHSLDYGIILPVSGGGGATRVNSVNGKTGDVVLNANDVGALPNTTVIPTRTSQLTNDSGFITESEVNIKRYNGIISENDWELVGLRYMYTLSRATHNLSNPMILDYLVKSENTGYSHGMYNYEVLTNGDILFTSDLNIDVKFVIIGE